MIKIEKILTQTGNQVCLDLFFNKMSAPTVLPEQFILQFNQLIEYGEVYFLRLIKSNRHCFLDYIF